jgi:Mg-chelatase subunit ChlD
MCEVSDVFNELNSYHKTQFLDSSGSCVRRDLNYDGTYHDGRSSSTFMTGRKHSYPDDSTTTASNFATCQYNAVEWDGSAYRSNQNSSEEDLSSLGCISASDLDICNVASTATFGLSTVDGWDNFDSKNAKGQICSSNSILYDVDDNHDGLIDWSEAHPDTSWAFFGFQQSGIYRSWPAIYQCRTEQQCSGCSDPRYRGWYASAASGPKDVVIVIDTSGSMNLSNRITRAKEAASWVVNTLTSADYASVVRFSSSASTWSSMLVPMTAENKASIKRWISELFATGETRMDLAMTLAFDILLDSSSSGASSNCQDNRNIVFMTDGDQTSGDVLAYTTSRNGNLIYDTQTNLDLFGSVGIARVHAFAVGDNADTAVTKSLACENAGLYRQIPDVDANTIIKEAIASYYLMSAASLVSNAGVGEVGARWTDIYEDGQGLGAMFAVCSSMYDYSLEPMDFFGVVCIGISMSTWDALSGADAERDSIIDAQSSCPEFTLDWMEMEAFRERASCESTCLNDQYEYCANYCGSNCENNDSSSDQSSSKSGGLVIGSIIAVSLLAVVAIAYFCVKQFCCQVETASTTPSQATQPTAPPTQATAYAVGVSVPGYGKVQYIQ